jgi:prepilin-type N-terminal cleavage/methylation domain-containing protein
MPARRRDRGTTLIEAMIAMAIIAIAAVGMVSLNAMGARMDGEARRVTRATAIAQDLLTQVVQVWPYTDGRLANSNTANDLDIGDTQFKLEQDGDPLSYTDTSGQPDHGEADLTAGGTTWLGLQAADIQGYQRYWSVSSRNLADGGNLDANGNGVADAVQVAAIVRFQVGASWRRVVVLGVKPNPADLR